MQPQPKGEVRATRIVVTVVLFALLLWNWNMTAANAAAYSFAAGALPPPGGLTVTKEGDTTVKITWGQVPGAAAYRVYRGTLPGSSYARIAGVAGSINTYADSGLVNQVTYFYVVTVIDGAGQESGRSNEVTAVPHLILDGVGKVVEATKITANTNYVLGSQAPVVWVGSYKLLNSVDWLPWPSSGVLSQAGYGPDTLPPAQWTNWVPARSYGFKSNGWDVVWAVFHPTGLHPTTETAHYHYAFRFSDDNGRSWSYAGAAGPIQYPDQLELAEPLGTLNVSDPTNSLLPPKITSLRQLPNSVSPDKVSLAWDPLSNPDQYLYYDIYRTDASSAEPVLAGRVLPGEGSFTEYALAASTTYSYTIRVVNKDGQYSPESDPVLVTTTAAAPVQVTIHLTPPALTPPGDTIYLNRAVDADGRLGPVNWTATPMVCPSLGGPLPVTCSVTISIQKGTYFSFLFSRGSPETVQTAVDGNSPAPDPSFWVDPFSGSSLTIDLVVANWDDPLIIAHYPADNRIPAGSRVSFTWNQPLFPDSRFLVEERNGASGPVPGTFEYNQATRTLTFYPGETLVGGQQYRVTFGEISDTKGIHQVFPGEWIFTAMIPLYVPLVSVFK